MLPQKMSKITIFRLAELVFKNMMKLPERNEDNFFMFLKTNEGYLSQIALKNMQFLVNYTLHEPTFIISFL